MTDENNEEDDVPGTARRTTTQITASSVDLVKVGPYKPEDVVAAEVDQENREVEVTVEAVEADCPCCGEASTAPLNNDSVKLTDFSCMNRDCQVRRFTV